MLKFIYELPLTPATAFMLEYWNFNSKLTQLTEFSDEPILCEKSLQKESAMMQSVKNSIYF